MRTRTYFPETVQFVPDATVARGTARVEVTFLAKAELPAKVLLNGVEVASGTTMTPLRFSLP
jgi:hypothetical protein